MSAIDHDNFHTSSRMVLLLASAESCALTYASRQFANSNGSATSILRSRCELDARVITRKE
eukprot:10718555-Alexandrium_andersonii.AAC.1